LREILEYMASKVRQLEGECPRKYSGTNKNPVGVVQGNEGIEHHRVLHDVASLKRQLQIAYDRWYDWRPSLVVWNNESSIWKMTVVRSKNGIFLI
jgi:hypothetical protein